MQKYTSLFFCLLVLMLFQNNAAAQCPPNNPIVVTNNGNVGVGTLSWAVNCANAFPNLDQIHFNLPAATLEITPTPSGPIPPINNNNIVIDARTQPVGTVVLNGIAAANQNGFTINGNGCSIFGFHITNYISSTPNSGAGIAVSNGGDNLIQENYLTNNIDGIRLDGGGFSFNAFLNTIGEDPSGNPGPNVLAGIAVENTSGMGTITNNVIAHNPVGVSVVGPNNVLISQNQFYCNTTEGINKIFGTPSTATITSATATEVAGTGVPGAIIEVFLFDNSGCSPPGGVCQGNNYLGTTAVTGTGNWTLPGLTLFNGQEVVVTSTEGSNTSEFSSCFTVTCTGVTILVQPSNLTVSCMAGTDLEAVYQAWIDACGNGVATSDCDPSITCQSVPFPPPPMPDLCGGSVTMSFAFIDGAGNTAISNPATFTILPDVTDPTITGVPGDLTVACDNIPAAANPMVSDNCDDDPSLSFTETITPSALCPQNSTILRVWTATDFCGNITVAPQVITVEDNAAPTFTVPGDITVGAGAGTDPSVTGDVTDEADNCDGNVMNGGPTEAIFTDTEMVVNCDRIITRAWSLTDACGNVMTGNQTITVLGDPPTATLTGSTSICEGEQTDLTVALTGVAPFDLTYSANGTVQPTITGIMDNTFLINVTPVVTTTYELVSIEDANCQGLITGTAIVTVSPSPPAFPSGMTECGDGSGQATFDLTSIENVVNGGTGDVVSWYFDQALTLPIPDPANLLSNSTFIFATVTNSTGCVSEFVAVELTVIEMTFSCSELDTVTVNGGNDGSAIIEVLSGGDPNYNYDWMGDNGLSGSGVITALGQPDTIPDLEAGDYDVTITDANGCTSTCTFTITEPFSANCDDFQIDTSSSTDVSCNGGADGTLEIQLLNGTSPFQFIWNDPSLDDLIADQIYSANSLSAGTYLTTITDDAGCQLFDTLMIDEPALLQIDSATVQDEICLGANNGSIQIFISGGNGMYTAQWDSGQTGTLISDLNPGTYAVTVTDGNACTTSSFYQILEGNSPTAFFEETGLSDCVGADFMLTLDLIGNTPFDLSYSDGQNQFDLLGIQDGHVLTVQPTQNTIYSIVSISDANGCTGTSSDTAILTVEQGPVVGDVEVTCNGNFYTAVFQVTSDLPFGVSGTSVADIAPDGTVTSNPIPIMTPYVFFINNDCGNVTLEGADNCDCLTFAGDFVEDTIQLCEGGIALATHENAILDNNDVLLFILQTANGNLENPLASNTIPSFEYNASLEYDTPYYIFAIAGNNDGTGNIDFDDPCLSVVQGPVVIFSEVPPDLLWVSGQETLCGGEDLLLETEAWSVENVLYHWLLPNGSTTITEEPSLIIPNVSTLDSGQYFVLMQWGDCISDALGFHHLTVNAPPSETVNLGADMTLCDMNSVVLNAPSPMLGCSGMWISNSTADIESPNGTSTVVNNLQPGANEFIWSVSCGACEDAARDTIVVYYAIPPVALNDEFTLEKAQEVITMNVLRNDQQLASDDELEVYIISQPSVGALEWLPNVQTFQYSEPSESYTGQVEFEYAVCNGAIDTCEVCDTALVIINILNLPKVPQAITPNNDGSNDYFIIVGLNEDLQNELIVINRWGSVVFKEDDYSNDNPWAGDLNRNGKALEQGAYYYQLTVSENENKVYQETGVTYIVQRE